MGDFTVTVAPIAKFIGTEWQVPIYIQRGIGNVEQFAHVYGATKDIANMRAALIVAAINKGITS